MSKKHLFCCLVFMLLFVGLSPVNMVSAQGNLAPIANEVAVDNLRSLNGWSGWQYCYKGTCNFYFAPGRTGNHKIEVQGTAGTWGIVKLYWRDGGGSWIYFYQMTVDNIKKTAILYSGTPSINYRFEFIEGAGAGDGKHRTYTD